MVWAEWVFGAMELLGGDPLLRPLPGVAAWPGVGASMVEVEAEAEVERVRVGACRGRGGWWWC